MITRNGLKISFSGISIIKWITNVAIVAYIGVLCILFVKGGFDYHILGTHISVNSPFQVLSILTLLTLWRIFLSIEIKNVLLLLAAICFSLLLSEGLLRVLNLPIAREPELKKWKRLDDVLGWEIVPLLKGKGNLGVDIQINSHGLRDIERSWDKPKGVSRVLALGDSFTYGYGLELEDTYVKQLELLLNADTKNIDVINAGVIHYNLYQALAYLKHKCIRYEPDLVIYFFYIDDIGGPHTAEEMKLVYQQLLGIEKSKKRMTFGPNLFFINFIKNTHVLIDNRLRPLIAAQWLRSIGERKKYLDPYIRSWSEKYNLEPLKKNIKELKDTVQKANANLLIVLIPDAVQIKNPSAQKMNQTLKDICSVNRIPFIDITRLFEKQSDIRALYSFPMDAHTSAKGDRLIAEAVYEKIREDRLLPILRAAGPYSENLLR